ncbi:sporulation-specific diadenylate cyclase CdaS [Psychrobacillus sp. OK032]|uniref:sporulation-specific diadenylate cyclase CdaS n=1 Tax=Psychrobacillus sp. OK032 TaxID=1884358 RepID=UPI000B877A04|nr:sporulation-specific diadenylate cyclase CdaS [Psychrobacillus sp. OK032]
MSHNAFDLTPLKKQLTERLENISFEINKGIKTLNDDSYCVLGELKNLKDKFAEVETMAASFYLNNYLTPYTDKYLEISTCIQHLSHQRHGALIVIERKDQVDPFIRAGTAIDATLTQSLLESIFYPGNLLHDGAALIRGDKIYSAANVLPLSSIVSGGKKLGTRHRAAIGLSEKCDALVLVVSEESGIISFAIDGSLFPISVTSSFI